MSASPSSSTSTLASATTAPDPTIIGERPNFDLGDDDVIADGGTKIMAKESNKKEPSAPKMSALDSLDAMVTKAKSDPPPPMKMDGRVGLKPKSFPPPPPMMKLASKTPTVVGGIGFEVDPTLAVASKESLAPAAPLPPPAAAPPVVLHDLTDDDLAGETKIDRTQPFDREVVVAAAAEQAQALALAGLPLQQSANGLPALPSVMVSPSIAPFSVDVPSADGTQKMPASQAQPQQRYYAPVPAAAPQKNNQMTMLAAAIGGGVALCAAALIALIVFATSESNNNTTPTTAPKPVATAPASPNAKQAAAQPLGPAKPREPQQSSIRSAVIETPETTPRKIDAPPPARDESGTPVTSPGALPSAPSSAASSPKVASDTSPPLVNQPTTKEPKEPKEKKTKASATSQPPPPPEPAAVAPPPPPPTPAAAAAATPTAPKVTSTVGSIEIPGSLMTVMIDGDYKRVNGGKVVVQCGRHKVNAGRGTQIVDVPCGGSVAVQ